MGRMKQLLSIGGLVMATAMLQGCNSEGEGGDWGTSESVSQKESNKGVITHLEEVSDKEYKITDEILIDDSTKSMAVIHNIDGSVDSVSVNTIQKEAASNPQYSAMNTILMYGLIATVMNRSRGGARPNAAYYKTPEAYNKSNGLSNGLSPSATSRRVGSPAGGKKGFGGGGSRSSRSFGG